MDVDDFPAPVGSMTLQQITRIIADVSKKTEIVGFSIGEHMSWDVINLRKALEQVEIFK